MEHAIHQNRLLKLAREGGQMTAQHLRDLEPARLYATLVAVIIDTRATLIDEIIDLHDRFMGTLFSKAKRNHADRFQQSGKAINDKVRLYSRIGRALLDAKQSGNDPYAAIEAIIPWEVFSESITEAETLAQPEGFDFLSLVGDGFTQLRRYTPILLEALTMKAAPTARELLAGVEVLKGMNERQARKVPDDAPTSFVRKRWESLVRTPDGLDRRFYELCVLSELKNSLRSGDIWVQGSRQFKDFEEYFKAGGRGHAAGQVNLKYGQEPGVQFYTHISDQYAPFHTKVINATVRDATHVLDGLLYHESDLRIEEHYTDTAGFTDHVFALMHLLGFRFAPRS